MIKGLLLDFYGTVVEEDDEVVADICAAVAATGTGTGVTPTQVGTAWWQALRVGMADTVFRPQRELVTAGLATAAAELGCTADPRTLCARQFAFWRTPPLRPGTRAGLAALDLPVCVVSNIDRDDLLAAVEHTGLAFHAVVTSQDAGAYKPARVVFDLALAALGLAGHEVLHVGDSADADVAGATAAGIRAVWVNRRRRPVPAGCPAVAVLDTLADLPAVLG